FRIEKLAPDNLGLLQQYRHKAAVSISGGMSAADRSGRGTAQMRPLGPKLGPSGSPRGKLTGGNWARRTEVIRKQNLIERLNVWGAPANSRSEITSPLRSAATISPIWVPDSVSTAPLWLTSTIPPAPGPTATPAPAAPYTPLTSYGVRMLLTVPTKLVAEAPKVNP